VNDVIEFLTEQYNKGLGYSALNTARGALSSLGIRLESFPAGSHPTVVRFMKGVYNLRTPSTRTTETWDVNKVLNHLRKLSPVKTLTLKDLTLKLTMLLGLTNAARAQTLHVISYKLSKKTSSGYLLKFNSLLKQSRPGFDCSSLVLKAYPPDRRLCVVTVLREYLSRTKPCRKDCDDSLLLSYVKPYKPVSRDTISRWIRVVMLRSGIDVNRYTAHSVRAAATSKAKAMMVPISDILKTAGWSQESTFSKFYNKTIPGQNTFAEAVLNM